MRLDTSINSIPNHRKGQFTRIGRNKAIIADFIATGRKFAMVVLDVGDNIDCKRSALGTLVRKTKAPLAVKKRGNELYMIRTDMQEAT